MEVNAIVKVNGLGEREYLGKVYRTANLYIDGRDADSVKANLPDHAPGLVKAVQEHMDKRCKAVLNLRNFKGAFFLDLVSLELLSGPGAPASQKS
jgi:hypothetical protein